MFQRHYICFVLFLGQHKQKFNPGIVGAILQMTLIPDSGVVCKAVAPYLSDTLFTSPFHFPNLSNAPPFIWYPIWKSPLYLNLYIISFYLSDTQFTRPLYYPSLSNVPALHMRYLSEIKICWKVSVNAQPFSPYMLIFSLKHLFYNWTLIISINFVSLPNVLVEHGKRFWKHFTKVL